MSGPDRPDRARGPRPDWEPQRVLGMPVQPGDWRPRTGGNEQRFLGVPSGWHRESGSPDTRWLRHPLRWAKWRLQVHKLGPYAPDYSDGPTGPPAS